MSRKTPLHLSQPELDLLKSVLLQRRTAYTDRSDDLVVLNPSHHMKLIKTLDEVMNTLDRGVTYLVPNARRLLQGCMEELSDELEPEIQSATERSGFSMARLQRDNPGLCERLVLVLAVWNKLIPLDERRTLHSLCSLRSPAPASVPGPTVN